MKKKLVYELHAKAEQIAKMYPNPNREHNNNNETFAVMGIKPKSETTATILFMKSSGKLALAFAYYINQNGGKWQYCFPTESHIIGMCKVANSLTSVDEYNFKKNGC